MIIGLAANGQDRKQLLNTYKNGSPSERVRAAEELMDFYISENKDTLVVLGEELFYYGIDHHYYPAIETGRIILAEYYVETGKTVDGITTAKALLPNMEERGDHEKLSIACKIICQGYRVERDATSAMYWAEQAVKHSKQSDDPEVQTYGLISLAECYAMKNKPDQAIKAYKDYIKKAMPLKLDRGITSAYARLGDIYRIKGNLEKAEFYFNASYKVAKRIGYTISVGHAINNLAIIYFEKGDTLKARKHFEDALQLRLKSKDKRAIADSYYNLGDYQFYIGKSELAEKWYMKSYEYAKKHQLYKEEKDALMVLANLYKSRNQFPDATKYLEMYIALGEKIETHNQRDDEKIKAKQLEFMKLESEAALEGFQDEPSLWTYFKIEWILVVLFGLIALVLAGKLRKAKPE